MSDIEHQYKQEDFPTMSLRVAAVMDFAEILDDYNLDQELDGSILGSIALILKTMLAPVEDFLSWAYTCASIPDDNESKTTNE